MKISGIPIYTLAKMPIEEIEEILTKYGKEEDRIEAKLLSKSKAHDIVDLKSEKKTAKVNLEDAKRRNQMIMKELETVKGNLRSRAIFNPVEMQWKRICENYMNEPSLVVKKWKCDIPIFV